MFRKVICRVFVFVIVASLATVMPASAKSSSMKGYKEISAEELKSLMDTSDPLVVFPLSSIEFKDRHITGSINVPLHDLETGLPGDKNRTVVFYCLGIKCTASWRAADRAVKLGYNNVYAFREGLPAWIKAGYPTTTVDKLPTIDVAKITTDQLFSKMTKGSDFVLLDVCLQRDAEKFWIDTPNRVHIPLDQLEARLADIPRDKEVIVICLKGKRSPTAIRYLSAKGFKNLSSVKGGMQQWILEGKPVKTS